jgi:predicted GNAT family acetyltransferase
MSENTITDNVAAHRYELEVDGHVTFAKYRLENKTLFIDYVEAPPPLRGTGAAGRLQSRKDGKLCPYAVMPLHG